MYLANLARDPANPIPVQPSSSAILAIFMLIGVFALVYLRTKSQQGNENNEKKEKEKLVFVFYDLKRIQ
ncbi:hypothetical protein G6F17_013941 [Rhizopus arrhizus]|nr:hypothetical protein G6F17_013941 [Rhizopus arrhizus]KAG1265792.1 hypothetical protein G6F66_014127 [Rhizopus arrhizus]KAG1387671.1 hypothetical protein G6F60_014025 [Rhizopus arrhizus]